MQRPALAGVFFATWLGTAVACSGKSEAPAGDGSGGSGSSSSASSGSSSGSNGSSSGSSGSGSGSSSSSAGGSSSGSPTGSGSGTLPDGGPCGGDGGPLSTPPCPNTQAYCGLEEDAPWCTTGKTYGCNNGDTPNNTIDPSLVCSLPVTYSNGNGYGWCCIPPADAGSTPCTPDTNTTLGCNPGSFEFVCGDAGTVPFPTQPPSPTAAYPALNCSWIPFSGDYCCSDL